MKEQPTVQQGIDSLVNDYKVMIKADTGHLAEALENGDRTEAHRCVDAIIDSAREIQDLLAR